MSGARSGDSRGGLGRMMFETYLRGEQKAITLPDLMDFPVCDFSHTPCSCGSTSQEPSKHPLSCPLRFYSEVDSAIIDMGAREGSPMNQKDKYVSDEPIPDYLHDVEVNGHQLRKGMHAILSPPKGRAWKREYEFRFAERYEHGSDAGSLVFTFYGPLGVDADKRRLRRVREHEVLKVLN
jgi:hypothetical protein